VLAHFGHHLVSSLLAPLLPLIRDDFALNYAQAGLVVSAFNLSYGIGQLPAGWLADRIGHRMLITVGISGVALSGLIIGLSPTYIIMVVFLVLLGLMGGGYHPAAAPLVSASVEPKNRGRALGLHQIGGSCSYFAGPLIAAAIAATLGWRGSFIVVSIPVIILGIVLYALLGRWGYAKKAEYRTPSGGGSHPETLPTQALDRWRYLVPFIILAIVVEALLNSTIQFIPLFLVDHFSRSKEAAAALLSIVYSSGFWAGPLGGYLSDRFGRVPVLLVTSLLAGPIVYLLGVVSYGWGLFLVLPVIGMSMFSRMPVVESYLISHASERRRSTVLGIYYFGSRGGPGIALPIMGSLADRFGFHTTFTIVGAVMLAVTLICFVCLRGSRDRPLHQ